MTAPKRTDHELTLDTIDLQLTSLSSGAPAAGPGDTGMTIDQIAARLDVLRRDRTTLLAHWDSRASNKPPEANLCDQPQPCPHALGIIQNYR